MSIKLHYFQSHFDHLAISAESRVKSFTKIYAQWKNVIKEGGTSRLWHITARVYKEIYLKPHIQ
jgi:hypothetical protein